MRPDLVLFRWFRNRIGFGSRRRDRIGHGNKRDGYVPLRHEIDGLQLSLVIVAIVQQQLESVELGGQLIEAEYDRRPLLIGYR